MWSGLKREKLFLAVREAVPPYRLQSHPSAWRLLFKWAREARGPTSIEVIIIVTMLLYSHFRDTSFNLSLISVHIYVFFNFS